MNRKLASRGELWILSPPLRSISNKQIYNYREKYLPSVDDLIQLAHMGAIHIAMDFEVFGKNSLLDFFIEFLLSHEVIFSGMLLTLSRSPCGVADRQLKYIWIFLQQELDESSLAYTRASTDHQWLELLDILMVVEIGEVFLGVSIDILGLVEEAGTEEIVKNLAEFGVALDVVDVLLLDGLLDGSEVGLQFGVEVLLVVLVH